ncbi:fungal-specific transcription factor domain-containing protein [Halenospora varia]|nr:fungal-specific transcription factor domain-containing protein [Halenospora varia]
MPPLSEYQTVFRIAKPDATTNGSSNRVTKRNRQAVSCLSCRTRKLKCDRQQPCTACLKRSGADAASCSYSSSSQSVRDKKEKPADSRTSEAQLRLQKLEEMVMGLMQNAGAKGILETPESLPTFATPAEQYFNGTSMADSPPSSENSSSGPGPGRLHTNGEEIKYSGATHWSTVLENIRDIRGVLDNETTDLEEDPLSTLPEGRDIFIDTTQKLTISDVCNSLPPRAVVDKLLSVYFSGKHNQNPILHSAKFLREYEAFWLNPASMSFLWISILFSALHIGAQMIEARGDEMPGLEVTSDLFLARSGQALVTGKYHKARPYSVEALLFFALCKYMRKEDMENNAWLLMGIAARLSLRMGYHRDPKFLAGISPFEGEMRRRTFFVIETLDLLLSFQAGLPPTIQEDECDTEPPSNLLDDDFDEDCEALPPSRPTTDPTPMLYYCEKSRMAKIFRRVIRHALSLKNPPYEETMTLEAEIVECKKRVPTSLRVRPLSASFTDEAHLILHRLNLDLLYLRSICVLHRKYLNHERENPIYDYSRKTCTEAAMQILKYQAELHEACLPGGQLHKDRWMPSTLIMYDFLLAVMIICLDLYESYPKLSGSSEQGLKRQVEHYDAVKLSYDIWASRRDVSRDARRASNVLAAMLSKLRRPHVPLDSVLGSEPVPTSVVESTDLATAEPYQDLWQNASSYTGLEPIDLADNNNSRDHHPTDYLNNLFNEPDTIDWELMDQCLTSLDPV